MHKYALHGYLGQPGDWKGFPYHAVDLLKFPLGLWEWAEAFNSSVEGRHFLIGYSLGGRLAMHALIASPEKWKGAVIISAHPGLQTKKKERLESDIEWARKFEEDPWDKVTAEWDAQEVFGGASSPFLRKEERYSRQKLGNMLRVCSLGRQDNLSPFINVLPMPILWVCGQDDLRFCAMAEQIEFVNPLSEVWIAPNAGHRVPWEQKVTFEKIVNQFFNRIGGMHDSNRAVLGNDQDLSGY